MKILLITPAYPTVNRSDLKDDTKAIHYFTKNWNKSGHEVTVFHMYLHSFKGLSKYRLYFGKKIFRSTLDGVSIYMMENRIFRRFKFISRLQMKIAGHYYNRLIPDISEPDVIIVHMPSELNEFVNTLQFECPYISVLHNTDIDKLQKGFLKIEELQHKYQSFIFRSKIIKENFYKMTEIRKGEFIAYSGVPTHNTKKIIENPIINKEMQILYVGRLIPLKKIDVIIKSLATLGEYISFHFNIIGSGEEEEHLKELTFDLNLSNKISFIGELPREDVLKYMEKSDVFVMVSSPETFGLVYIEAMSMGCITVGAKGEGIDGVIKDGENGFLVTPDDSKMLSDCIIKIYNMSDAEKNSIISNAIQTTEYMSEDNMARLYLENVIDSVKGCVLDKNSDFRNNY